MKKTLLFCLTVLLLAACNLMPGASDSPTDSPQTNYPPTITAAASDLTQTHTDSVLGIRFDYPAGWIVDNAAPAGELIQLYSPTALTPQPGRVEGFGDDQTKIEFIKISPASPYSTIDGYIEFYQKGGDGPSGTMEVLNRMTLAGDIPAARLQFNSAMAGNVSVVVFEINGVLVSAAGYGDVSRFDEILGTLRRAET